MEMLLSRYQFQILVVTCFLTTACCLSPEHTHHSTCDFNSQQRLEVNADRIVEINASALWNDTGVSVCRGDEYEFSVSNTSFWYDRKTPSMADGYSFFWFYPLIPLRRVMSAPWFALICTIDYEDAFKVFDHSICFRNNPISGESPKQDCHQVHGGFLRYGGMYCYANDLTFMYGNNRGILNVTIKRIR